MKRDLEFWAGVLLGLYKAIREDVDVFLMALAGLFLSFRLLRGLGIALLFYIAVRRADGMMTAYLSVKRSQVGDINSINQST